MEQNVARLGPLLAADDTGAFELRHDATGAVEADFVVALDHRGRDIAARNCVAGDLGEERVVFHRSGLLAALTAAAAVRIGSIVGQRVGFGIALLAGDVIDDALHLLGLDQRTLDTGQLAVLREEHVTAPDQLVGARLVDDRARVDHLHHAEGDTGREVGRDTARNDLHVGTLRGDDQVDADGAGFLRQTHHGSLDLAGGHDQVGELIDDDDNIRQVTDVCLLYTSRCV